jgi:hypothetical protein
MIARITDWIMGAPPHAIKQIICLANSRKRGGRCVAGKERLEDGRLSWVRPVSNRRDEEIAEREYKYADGGCPGLLDVIDVPVIGPRPTGFQTENWLIRPKGTWVRRGRAGWRHLATLADNPSTLWSNGSHSLDGLNNRVPEAMAAAVSESLYLLHARNLTLRVCTPRGAALGASPHLQADFTWLGEHYSFRVTDPQMEWNYLRQSDGGYPLGECFLTVSLSLPYMGFCYKLVAAVIQPSELDG